MATAAIGSSMGSYQGKSFLLVNLLDVGHQPRTGVVATLTIVPDSLLVYVGMTRITITFCLVKEQCRVAFPAIEHFVLPFEWEMSPFVMVKGGHRPYFPAIRVVTFATLDVQSLTMRGFCRFRHLPKESHSPYEKECKAYKSMHL